MLPIGAITDIIPDNFFGREYAVHRMPFWERNEFINAYLQSSIWEYNGSYYRFIAFTCKKISG